MNQKVERAAIDEMRPEYEFSGAVRGKYSERYRAGTNVVLLDADVAEIFPTSQNVNDALRVLIHAAQGKVVRRVGRAREKKSLTSSGLERPSEPRRQRVRRGAGAGAGPKRG